MAKEKEKKVNLDEELTLEQAQSVIRRLGNPERKIKELELLKQASVVVAKETQPEFEFDDGEGNDVNIELSSDEAVSSELTKPPSFFEHAGAQVASLGTAGVMAIASATYFQVDTVVEQTREVVAVAEEKWEEFEEEHPNFNWDDPFEAFTTVVGIGELDIDIDPTTGTAIPSTEQKEINESTTLPKGTESSGEETPTEEVSEESTEAADESDTKDDDSNEKAVEEEEKEEPKKKKKGFFGLFSGDDEDEEEDEESDEEESAEEVEEAEEESEEESEAEEESKESEPEAEEEPAQEEKPKKKSGGLFRALFGGGDDEESEEPEDEQQGEEPTQDDDTVSDEQAEEESTEEPKAETAEGEADGTEPTAKSVANTDTAESNGITEKKSSGGGLFSFLTNKEEVVKNSEVSAEEEPEILVADSEQAPEPLSEETEIEIQDESIDAIDDIKPHSMVDVEVAEVEVEVKVEVAEIEMDVQINIEDILEMSEIAIEDVQIADIGREDIIDDIEKVITPFDGIVVSPSGALMLAYNN
tara:strand:- start:283 stop:1872 length:1590 start_codon:yes stop_codon:yes gene_type:complete